MYFIIKNAAELNYSNKTTAQTCECYITGR